MSVAWLLLLLLCDVAACCKKSKLCCLRICETSKCIANEERKRSCRRNGRRKWRFLMEKDASGNTEKRQQFKWLLRRCVPTVVCTNAMVAAESLLQYY